MTKANEFLNAGQLSAALEQVTQEVKAKPSDGSLRIFLFELLCFAGEFDRAEKQLDVIGHQNAEADLAVQVYHNNIKAERSRLRLFSDGLQPHFLSEPPAYVDLQLAAINRLREGNFVEAREVLNRAEEKRPALSGKCKERPFKDFQDYDDIVGPVLELIVHDKYTWLPFEQVRRMEIPPPKQLRDLMWAPARIESLSGTTGEVFVPALYAGSYRNPNDQVKLGRMTDWQQVGEDVSMVVGQRLFLVDGDDVSIFEAEVVEFSSIPSEVQAISS